MLNLSKYLERYVKRLIAFIFFATFTSQADAITAACSIDDPRFFTGNLLVINVRLTGSDVNPHCGETVATACRTVERAKAQIPNGWTSPVDIQLGPGDFAIPTTYWDIRPGAYTSGTSVKEGSVTVRGACEAPLATWASAPGSAVPGRFAQRDFVIPGGWVGSIGEATHYVRYSNAQGPSALIARTSTTPTLRVISQHTDLPAGTLCAWETSVTNADVARYAAQTSNTGNPVVQYAGLKFLTTVDFYRVRIIGVWVGEGPGVRQPGLIETGVYGSYFQYHNTVYSTADTRIPQPHSGVLWAGCPQFRGQFLTVDGVITGSCAASAQISFGIFNEDPPSYGTHQLRNFGNTDFEGTGPCIRMHETVARVGIVAGNGISCNTSTGEFAILDLNSRLSVTPGALITGSVVRPTQIRNGSTFGPASGSYGIVNSGPGIDFTVGTILNVPASTVTLSDPIEEARFFN